jgi:phosphoribosylanthranilate isomerase
VGASIKPHVKICCIASVEEARLAIESGAAAIGLVSEMPSGPGVIEPARIREIASAVRGEVESFLLTSRVEAEAIVADARDAGVTTLQLVDQVAAEVYADLRRALPRRRIVQVIHVTGQESIESALDAAHHVDALLLDSGNPVAKVRELGGTGRRHDWSISRTIRERAPIPVWLAGGLRAENVRAAIDEVGAYGLDVCSGVRTNGALDAAKLAAFMEAVRG